MCLQSAFFFLCFFPLFTSHFLRPFGNKLHCNFFLFFFSAQTFLHFFGFFEKYWRVSSVLLFLDLAVLKVKRAQQGWDLQLSHASNLCIKADLYAFTLPGKGVPSMPFLEVCETPPLGVTHWFFRSD